MAARVTVERDGEGRLVVRKEASGDDTGDLSAEAAWLRRAAGSGVVHVVDDDPAAGRLTTLHAGAHTWRTARPDPQRGGALAAAALRAVARVHGRGLVHGALGADHLVLGPDGPVLCSPHPGAQDPTGDRRALARLLAEAAERWRGEGRAVPASWQRAVDLLDRPEAGWSLDDIAGLLDPATGPGPAGGRARRWATRSGARPDRRRVLRLGRRAAAGAAVGLGAAAVVTAVAMVGAVREPPDPSPPAPAGTGSTGRGPAGYRLEEGDGSLAAPSRPCPGSPPAALLDPATGEVWAFPDLPVSGSGVSGIPVQRSPGADRLVVRPDGDCERIVAVGPAGEAPVRAVAAGSGARQGDGARPPERDG